MFIVAHFLSVFIYDSFVVDDELLNGSGVDLRALQASIYVIIPMMILSKELKLASLAVAGMYILSASEWLLFDHGIELDIQAYFYSHFSGIIDTLDLIIIYLLGRDSAIRIFNIVDVLIITVFVISIYLSAIRILKTRNGANEGANKHDK